MGCPVEACTEVVGGKWKGKILFILFTGTKRFGELRKLLPDTTQRMLTMQLRELEEDGVIERKVYAQVPPKVEYSISKSGDTLKPIVDAMWHWGRSFLDNQPDDLEIDRDPAHSRMSSEHSRRSSPSTSASQK
jgi:DNA-binding HxlR family transcriptional regulator